MNWFKTVSKSIFGLLTGVVATAASNPEAITTLAGGKHAVTVGAICALLSGLANWLKHKDDV